MRFKYLTPIILLSLLFTIANCSKNCDEENDEIVSDIYYVKYEVNSSTIYYGGKLDVRIKKEDNLHTTYVVDQRTLWEATIGPVQKGFIADLKVEAQSETYDKLKLYTNIYVSKNDSPFALKESDGSDTPRDFVHIDYTIDY